MSLVELMKGMGEKLGCELPVEDGMAVVGIDDMSVTISELAELDAVAVYAEIGEPPPQGLEKLLLTMLEANHLFMGTSGATISRDPESGKFCLCRIDNLDVLNLERFMAMIEKFVNVLESWRKIISDYRPCEAPATDANKEQVAETPQFGGLGNFMQV